MCSRRLGRLTNPRGSRGGRYRVAHDLLYGGVLQSTRALLHKALVADVHGNVNAYANVAAAPSADAARALEGQGGVTGRGWKADLAEGLERRGLLPIREEGLWSSAAPGGAAAAWGAGGASVNTCQHINPYRLPPCYRHATRRRHRLARPRRLATPRLERRRLATPRVGTRCGLAGLVGSGRRRRDRSPWRGRRSNGGGRSGPRPPGGRRGGGVGGVAQTARRAREPGLVVVGVAPVRAPPAAPCVRV